VATVTIKITNVKMQRCGERCLHAAEDTLLNHRGNPGVPGGGE